MKMPEIVIPVRAQVTWEGLSPKVAQAVMEYQQAWRDYVYCIAESPTLSAQIDATIDSAEWIEQALVLARLRRALLAEETETP